MTDPARAAFACDLLAAIDHPPHHISPKYFYDDEGSGLFEAITGLPEYYPTRTELDILKRPAPEMAECMGPDIELVEYGAGASRKVRFLLDALPALRRFVPVDIAGDYLDAAAAQLRQQYPQLCITPVTADFCEPLPLPATLPGVRRAGFFPGSTLGNLDPDTARRFLAQAARQLAGGGLLIGIDLVKDPVRLHAAYNDSAGLTARFNRNLLERANRELGCDFVPQQFQHYAFYQPALQRIEMHLVSTRAQTVRIGTAVRTLSAGQHLHTENSHKFTLEGFGGLARQAGLVPQHCWTDAGQDFAVFWLVAPATGCA